MSLGEESMMADVWMRVLMPVATVPVSSFGGRGLGEIPRFDMPETSCLANGQEVAGC